MNQLVRMKPEDVRSGLEAGTVLLVDVREADEHAREHIQGALNAPLSRFDGSQLPVDGQKQVVFMCRSGARTQGACDQLSQGLAAQAYVLSGGIDSWKKAGLPVIRDAKQPLELMRQVQMAAGGLILTGAVLGSVVHPAFWGISAFVGAGLFVAGATGFCGMANLLRQMPWNRAMRG